MTLMDEANDRSYQRRHRKWALKEAREHLRWGVWHRHRVRWLEAERDKLAAQVRDYEQILEFVGVVIEDTPEGWRWHRKEVKA